MSGGAPKAATATTTSGPPPWASRGGQNYYRQVYDLVQGLLGAGYPSGLNQQVAPFGGAQTGALSNIAALTPAAQNYANQGVQGIAALTNPSAYGGIYSVPQGTLQSYAHGDMMGPNPYLNQYYNQAATQATNQYLYGTQPSLQAQFQQAGAFNSPGFAQAQGQAQYGLGQSLATLGANIYEPAYQFESGQRLSAANALQQNRQFNAGQNLAGIGAQLSAAEALPGSIASLYAPSQALYGAGSAQQQQAQNLLNANRTNAGQQLNFPFALLSQLGAALGQANLGAGTTTATGPASTGGGLFGK